jgi:hypothetical protein
MIRVLIISSVIFSADDTLPRGKSASGRSDPQRLVESLVLVSIVDERFESIFVTAS